MPVLLTWILRQVLLEPYSRAYYFGSERVSKRYNSEPEQDSCDYKDIKALCEQPFSGYYLLLLTGISCGPSRMSPIDSNVRALGITRLHDNKVH